MGQVGDALVNQNTYGPQPSGFDSSDWIARFLGSGMLGLGNGLQNQAQQSAIKGYGGAINPMQYVPQPQQPGIRLPGQNNGNPFMGGYGGY